YDQVSWRQFMSPLPECFSYDTLDCIARDCERSHALRNNQPKAGAFGIERHRPARRRNDKKLAPRQMLTFESRCKLGRAMQTGRWGKTGSHHAGTCSGRGVVRMADQTAKRLRPLERRALMTARPPRVFMRTRKP